jgi:chromosome partitioning protein
MSIYAIWNNKGGVGKSYLTFQIACEYARTHPNQNILVIDMCPQANASGMLLGGMVNGEAKLNEMATSSPKRTIAGYIKERIRSPYSSPKVGANYITKVATINSKIPPNLYLVVGDEELEIQASRVANATNPGPDDAWRLVHNWISDLIADVKMSWNVSNGLPVFIDCNPSFSIYTELALSAAHRLIIPFSADGSSKRAVRAVLALIYGVQRTPQGGGEQSEFYLKSDSLGMRVPQIYCYVGNRLTQMHKNPASAFKTVVSQIGDEIWSVWRANPGCFCVHPSGQPAPSTRPDFNRMFQAEINDANTVSVVTGALGIPLSGLRAGQYDVAGGKTSQVNEVQLDKLRPNIEELVRRIE